MNLYKYILALTLVTVLISSCTELDLLPQDGPESQWVEEKGAPLILPGAYSQLVENNWEKMYYQMTEFMGDNIALSGRTSDPLFQSYTYEHITEQGNASALWSQGYNIIGTCNGVIPSLEEELTDGTISDDNRQALGEFKFLRAYVHFALCGIWGRPYSHGRDNPGIVLADGLSEENSARATVGEIYDFVEAEMLEAADLLTVEKSNSKATKEAARAILSRLYLYREQNDKAIEFADLVIESDRYSLEPIDRFRSYFTFKPSENTETIMCIAHTEETDAWWYGLGSMYSNYKGVGWGEMYASQAYRELVGENDNDARHAFVDVQYTGDDDSGIVDVVSGERVFDRNGFAKVFVNKFSLQEGIAQLGSPIIVRLAEMYLNKAEAHAKLSQDQLALDNLNIIRQRAGLSGDQLYRPDNMLGRASVLDAALDERRLELAWEGHRAMDVYRNRRTMDRSYPGTHLSDGATTQLIPYTDPRILHYIPQREIELNPLLEQND